MRAEAVVGHQNAAVDDDVRVRALEDLGVLYTKPEERFDRITRLAQQLFRVATATVTLIDRDRQYFKSKQGLDLLSHPREDAFCNHTIRQDSTLVVEDLAVDPRFAANPLVAGDPHVRFYAGHPLEAPGGHRVGTLCLIDDQPRVFTEPERTLLQELAGWVQNELTRSSELEHAAEVQRGLFPRRSPRIPGYEVAGVCLPSRGVGGDFLDWYRAPDGRLTLTLGDVMGKGMAAAIVMAMVRTAMRAAARSGGSADAVREAAATLQEDLEQSGTLVTLFHAVLGPDDGALRFADAGHGLMLLVGADGSIRRPPSGGLPLGVLPDQEWDERTVRLEPGDVAVVFSDGLLDLYDGTLGAVDEIAAVVRDSSGAAEVVDRFAGLARLAGLLDDDVTVLAVRRTP